MSGERPQADAARGVGRSYHPLLLILAAVAAGIVVDRCWPAALGQGSALGWWLLAALALVAWLGAMRLRRERLASCTLLAACAAAGGAWGHDRWNVYPEDAIGRMVREEIRPICLEAVA